MSFFKLLVPLLFGFLSLNAMQVEQVPLFPIHSSRQLEISVASFVAHGYSREDLIRAINLLDLLFQSSSDNYVKLSTALSNSIDSNDKNRNCPDIIIKLLYYYYYQIYAAQREHTLVLVESILPWLEGKDSFITMWFDKDKDGIVPALVTWGNDSENSDFFGHPYTISEGYGNPIKMAMSCCVVL